LKTARNTLVFTEILGQNDVVHGQALSYFGSGSHTPLLAVEIRMETERWIRPGLWRYLLLANAIVAGIAVLLAAGSYFTTRLETSEWLGIVWRAWALLAVVLSLDYLLERRTAWRVDSTGIAVFVGDRQAAFLPWSDVKRIRVLPLGWVFVSTRSRPLSGWSILGVSRAHAQWLQLVARERMRQLAS
jgi:hypothetical protein